MITLQICATHALHCMHKHNLMWSVKQRIELNSDGLKCASKARSSYHLDHAICEMASWANFAAYKLYHQKPDSKSK